MLFAAVVDNQGTNILEVVLHGGSVSKVVLLLLAAFSIISWVIIRQKVVLMWRSRSVTEKFRAEFRKTTDWRDLKQAGAVYKLSPLLGLFSAGYTEVTYQL